MSRLELRTPETVGPDPRELLDKDIAEAAAQLLGHDLVDDYAHRRFVLLCAARAEFENEALVGFDPQLQWVEIAKEACAVAAKQLNRQHKGYFSFPHLLSDAPSAVAWQREIHQNTVNNLVMANTDQSPEVHWGTEFAGQVAIGAVQIRYV